MQWFITTTTLLEINAMIPKAAKVSTKVKPRRWREK
jgi:hypothetical protein